MRNSGENGSEMTVKHLWKEGAVPVSGVSDPMSEIGESDTWMDQVKTLIRQNKLAAASAVLILLIILAAVFAPLVAPYDHLAQSLTDRLQTSLGACQRHRRRLTGWEQTSWDEMC